MSINPNAHGHGIAPPRTGEYQLSQLMQYPNRQVCALAHHLRHEFGWWNSDSFTGEYITHLCNFVEQGPSGRFDFSRIQAGAGEGDGHQSLVSVVRNHDGRGPAPHRIEYIESRAAFCRRVGQTGARHDGSYLVGFERIGRVCFSNGTRDRRGRFHLTPSSCHTW